jgi:hypothetical protein
MCSRFERRVLVGRDVNYDIVSPGRGGLRVRGIPDLGEGLPQAFDNFVHVLVLHRHLRPLELEAGVDGRRHLGLHVEGGREGKLLVLPGLRVVELGHGHHEKVPFLEGLLELLADELAGKLPRNVIPVITLQDAPGGLALAEALQARPASGRGIPPSVTDTILLGGDGHLHLPLRGADVRDLDLHSAFILPPPENVRIPFSRSALVGQRLFVEPELLSTLSCLVARPVLVVYH